MYYFLFLQDLYSSASGFLHERQRNTGAFDQSEERVASMFTFVHKVRIYIQTSHHERRRLLSGGFRGLS